MKARYIIEFDDCNNLLICQGFTNKNTLKRYVYSNKVYFSRMKFYKTLDGISFTEISFNDLEKDLNNQTFR